jgi:hypothetical protein
MKTTAKKESFLVRVIDSLLFSPRTRSCFFFLSAGSVVLEGRKLVELCRDTKIHHDLKADKFAFLPFFELQRNPQKADNRFVKGSIQIGFEKRSSDARRSPVADESPGKGDSSAYSKVSENITFHPNNCIVEEPRPVREKTLVTADFLFKTSAIHVKHDSSENSFFDPALEWSLLVLLNGQVWYELIGKVCSVTSDTQSKSNFLISWNSDNSDKSFFLSFPEHLTLGESFLEILILAKKVDLLASSSTISISVPCDSSFSKSSEVVSGVVLSGHQLFRLLNEPSAVNLELNYPMVTRPSYSRSGIISSSLVVYCDKREIKSLKHRPVPIPFRAAVLKFPTIFTELKEENRNWSYYFEGPMSDRSFSFANVEGKESRTKNSGDEESPFLPRARRSLLRTLVRRNDDSKSADLCKTELAAMDFTLTIKSRFEEEHRVYWRGKMLPKNTLFTSEKSKQSILSSRSSRLLRTKSIHDMEVMADVHYLVDFGDSVVSNDDLPICVREIVTSGPGLISRVFRMELLTNTGILLGTADIQDEREDILSCIGMENSSQLQDQSKDDWDYQSLFEFIAKERVIFNMMSGERKNPVSATNRREGMLQAKSDPIEAHSGSVITIRRSTKPGLVSPVEISASSSVNRSQISLTSASNGLSTDNIISTDLHDLFLSPTIASDEQLFYLVYGSSRLVEIFKQNKIRIFSRYQRITGISFRCVIFLSGIHPPFIARYKQPNGLDSYFSLYGDNFDGLKELIIFIVCVDSKTKKVYELSLLGKHLADWAVREFQYSGLGSKFRRNKFGILLTSYVSLTFLPSEDFSLRFSNGSVPVFESTAQEN